MHSLLACFFYLLFVALFLRTIWYLIKASSALQSSFSESSAEQHWGITHLRNLKSDVVIALFLAGFAAMPAGVLPALVPPPVSTLLLVACFGAGVFICRRSPKEPILHFFWNCLGSVLVVLGGTLAFAFLRGLPGLTTGSMDAFVATPVWAVTGPIGILGLLAAFSVCLLATRDLMPPLENPGGFVWHFFYSYMLVCIFLPAPFPLPAKMPLVPALIVQIAGMWIKVTIVALFIIPLFSRNKIPPWLFRTLALSAKGLLLLELFIG